MPNQKFNEIAAEMGCCPYHLIRSTLGAPASEVAAAVGVTKRCVNRRRADLRKGKLKCLGTTKCKRERTNA